MEPNKLITISIGIMSFCVLLYRVIYIGGPYFRESFKKKRH